MKIKEFFKQQSGLIIALIIMVIWLELMFFNLNLQIDYYSPITYLLILLQTHLYTGLFITAHDSMHHSLSKNKFLNDAVGFICTTLFAFNSYKTLKPKHYMHHRYVNTEQDPDYKGGNFFAWYYKFLTQYVSIKQIVFIALLFNFLLLFYKQENVILFWVIPSLLSTLQLFFFGTYLPHRGEHDPDNFHKANTLKKNHLFAFISCYFFGYHYEHHDSPGTPWWKLYSMKK